MIGPDGYISVERAVPAWGQTVQAKREDGIATYVGPAMCVNGSWRWVSNIAKDMAVTHWRPINHGIR